MQFSSSAPPPWPPSLPPKADRLSLLSPGAVTADLALGLLSSPYIPAYSFQLSRIPGDFCPCPEDVTQWQGLPVWFSFLSTCRRSAAVPSDSLKCFPSVPNHCPMWGSDPCFCPSLPVQAQSRSLSSSSLPSFILLGFVWVYVLFPCGQGPEPTVRWSSARSSASEDVFLVRPWRPAPPPSSLLFLVFYVECLAHEFSAIGGFFCVCVDKFSKLCCLVVINEF